MAQIVSDESDDCTLPAFAEERICPADVGESVRFHAPVAGAAVFTWSAFVLVLILVAKWRGHIDAPLGAVLFYFGALPAIAILGLFSVVAAVRHRTESTVRLTVVGDNTTIRVFTGNETLIEAPLSEFVWLEGEVWQFSLPKPCPPQAFRTKRACILLVHISARHSPMPTETQRSSKTFWKRNIGYYIMFPVGLNSAKRSEWLTFFGSTGMQQAQ